MAKPTEEQITEVKRLAKVKNEKGEAYRKLVDTIWDESGGFRDGQNIPAAIKASEEHAVATKEFLKYLETLFKQ